MRQFKAAWERFAADEANLMSPEREAQAALIRNFRYLFSDFRGKARATAPECAEVARYYYLPDISLEFRRSDTSSAEGKGEDNEDGQIVNSANKSAR